MSLKFRIEQKDEFRVVGYVIHTTNEKDKCRNDVPSLWGNVIQQGKLNDLFTMANESPAGVLGISSYNTDPEDNKKFNYYIACATNKAVPEEMVEYTVPAATWAVFPCKRDEIASVEIQIVNDWAPKSEYELINKGYETGKMQSGAPDMELHLLDSTSEVWIAVRKKS